MSLEPLNENAGAVFKEALEKIKCPFWVSAGTALGLHRDGDFIKGDTDLDVAMVGRDGIELDLISWLPGFKVWFKTEEKGKIMQLVFKKDGVVFDVYFHYPNGENYENINDWGGKTIMPKRIYDDLKFIKTKYGKVPLPDPIEEYLEIRYGKDWKVPQSKKPTFH